MMKTDRPAIVFFAYSEVGWLCLQTLLNCQANVAAVVTHPDDSEENIWFHSVAELAQTHQIPTIVSSRLDETQVAQIKALKPELIISAYYRALIPASVLALPRLGAFNIHGALLPLYRGRACVNWAVLNGENETGATLHVMTSEADKGDIIDAQAVPIDFTDTGHQVFLKVAQAARTILERSLDQLETGTAPRRSQDESQATSFGRRRPEDGRLDWNKSALELYHLVRSVTHPFPGAFTTLAGRKLFIWSAWPCEGSATPGLVISSSPLVVGTASGLLELRQVQLEGQAEGDASAVAHLINADTLLGSSLCPDERTSQL